MLLSLIDIDWSSGLTLYLSLFFFSDMLQGNSEEFYPFIPLAGAAQPCRPPSPGKIELHMLTEALNVSTAQLFNLTKLCPNVKRQTLDHLLQTSQP